MHRMKAYFPLIYFCALCSCLAEGWLVRDPLAANLTRLARDNKDIPLWRCDLDLNNDGNLDILLADNYPRNGKQGFMWGIYLWQSTGGYFHPKEIISFNPKSATFRVLGQDPLPRLYRYSPGGAGRGIIIKFIIEGLHIREEIVAEDVAPGTRDEDLFKEIFAPDLMVKTTDVSKTPIPEVKPGDPPNIVPVPDKVPPGGNVPSFGRDNSMNTVNQAGTQSGAVVTDPAGIPEKSTESSLWGLLAGLIGGGLGVAWWLKKRQNS